MSTAATAVPARREPELLGQTVVVIGGSSGIGLETARRARVEGAGVILAARDPERLQHAATELGALSTAAVRLPIDGQPPGAAHGIDVDGQGNGMLTEPRLYQLIRQPKPIADRKFEIQVLDSGVEASAFTFG